MAMIDEIRKYQEMRLLNDGVRGKFINTKKIETKEKGMRVKKRVARLEAIVGDGIDHSYVEGAYYNLTSNSKMLERQIESLDKKIDRIIEHFGLEENFIPERPGRTVLIKKKRR